MAHRKLTPCCFVLFMLLMAACSGGNKVKADEQQQSAEQQATEESTTTDHLYIEQQDYSGLEGVNLSTVYLPRFALINTDGTKAIYLHERGTINRLMAEKYTHAIFGNRVFPLHLEEMQPEMPDCDGRAINNHFNELKGAVYAITEGNLLTQAVATINPLVKSGLDLLLVDEEYLSNLELIDVQAISTFSTDQEELKPTPVTPEEKQHFENLFQRKLSSIRRITESPKFQFYQMIFPLENNLTLCVIALKTDDQTLCLEETEEDGEFWMEYFDPIIISAMKKAGRFQFVMFVKTEDGAHSVLVEERTGKLAYSSQIKSSRMTMSFDRDY